MSEGTGFRAPGGNPKEASRSHAAAHPATGPGQEAASKSNGPPERRKRRRALISAPVRVRSVYGSSNGPDETSTTVDVSRNGLLFVSARSNFSQGMVVAVTLPYSDSPAAVHVEQPARVVRVSKLADGRCAVAIAFGAARRETRTSTSAESFSNSSASSLERPLVIVVDADAEIRDSLKRFLTLQGYEVMAVSNARQAHTLLNQLLPSLLIAEIEGYELPGLDLCARIKSTPRLQEIPVVLTTRSAFPSDYANAHSLGAVVCMAKPFRLERLGHVARLLVSTPAGRVIARPAHGNGGPADGNGSGDASFRITR